MSLAIRLGLVLLAISSAACGWFYRPFYARDTIVAVDVSLETNASAAAAASRITLVRGFVRGSQLTVASAAISNVVESARLADLELKPTGFRVGTWDGVAGTAVAIDPSPQLRRFEERIVEALSVFMLNTENQEEFIVTPQGTSMKGSAIESVQRFVPDASGVNFRPQMVFDAAHADAVRQLQTQPLETLSFKPVGAAMYQVDGTGAAQRLLWKSTGEGTRQ
jgi:hypothetical protein